MSELLRLFGEITLSRKGPQDLPASPLLLLITVAGYAALAFVVNLLLSPSESWVGQLLLEIVFTLAWNAVLLKAFGKPERFLQTATAVFGYQLVLAAPFIAVMSLTRSFPENSTSPWQIPVMVAALALVIWMIRAGSYVLKAALELPMIACVALIFAEILASQLVLVAFNTIGSP